MGVNMYIYSIGRNRYCSYKKGSKMDFKLLVVFFFVNVSIIFYFIDFNNICFVF